MAQEVLQKVAAALSERAAGRRYNSQNTPAEINAQTAVSAASLAMIHQSRSTAEAGQCGPVPV